MPAFHRGIFPSTTRLFFFVTLFFCFSLLAFAQSSSSLKIFFLGDLDFGESYQSDPKFNSGINIKEKFSNDYFFEIMRGLLSTSNLTIANLETPLADSITPKLSLRKLYSHWSSPLQTVECLNKYYIKVVSLGNNHAFDCGTEGLNSTISALQSGGIEFFGAGNNIEQSEKPFIKQFVRYGDSITIAVFTGFEYRQTYDSLFHFYAKENSPGVNKISIENISKQIEVLRNEYNNLFVILFPHWGKNYQWKTDKQTETAHELIDAGADLIIGQGSHMLQEVERYNGHWIIYSIGNSVFNAPGRYEYYNAPPYSFIAELVFRINKEDRETHLRLYPVFTDNLKCSYQIRFLNNDEIENCYRILEEKSSDKITFKNEFRLKEANKTKFFEIQLN
jgi:poly-gamma-glutamate capsule biosynthesis protein CapA/YwtB (metallophosphatase superfamily)